jgi:hypothetical protein
LVIDKREPNDSDMALKTSPLKAAKIAIDSIGLGYDVAADLRLKFCKRSSKDSCLIEIDHTNSQEIILPGGIAVPDVPKVIKCDKGERIEFQSDVLTFQQVCMLLSLTIFVCVCFLFNFHQEGFNRTKLYTICCMCCYTP